MNVTENVIENINKQFSFFRSSEIYINAYFEENEHLHIVLKPLNKNRLGITFFNTTYFAGRIQWKESNLKCKSLKFANGSVGIEVTDTKAKFIVMCHNLKIFGDKGITIFETGLK